MGMYVCSEFECLAQKCAVLNRHVPVCVCVCVCVLSVWRRNVTGLGLKTCSVQRMCSGAPHNVCVCVCVCVCVYTIIHVFWCPS